MIAGIGGTIALVTNKSQSDSSFCVIINIFENKGLFMMHKKIKK